MNQLRAIALLLWIGLPPAAFGQSEGRTYAGGLVGLAALSADAQFSTEGTRAETSLYKPENGPTLNLFAGRHLGRYLSVQANYVWNRNDLTLFASTTSPQGGGFYEQERDSTQHAVVGDLLLYFRALGDGVRPYLSTGLGIVRFESQPAPGAMVGGLAAPEAQTASTHAVLRVAVGIDLAIVSGWSVRYSFSETISGNPVSRLLTPPGRRSLANFHNLFGAVRYF